MRIRVYAPPIGDHSRIDEDGCVELPEGAKLDELLKLLRLPFRHGLVLLMMVNHRKARLSQVLADGDSVSFLSLVAGG